MNLPAISQFIEHTNRVLAASTDAPAQVEIRKVGAEWVAEIVRPMTRTELDFSDADTHDGRLVCTYLGRKAQATGARFEDALADLDGVCQSLMDRLAEARA